MSEAQPDPVLLEIRESVAWITLNRPAAMNAISTAVRERLPALLRLADDDPAVRAIVLRGAGDRAFSAGADIKEFPANSDPAAYREARVRQDWIQALDQVRKPLIAAIHGICFGGGLEVALACDIRLAGPAARFALPEVSLAIIPGAGGTQRLPRVVGLGRAMDMILSGEPIDAEEALRVGLVSRIAREGDVFALAGQVAALIASRGPLAVRAAKEAVREGTELELRAGLRLELDLNTLLIGTADRNEAALAFREKRKPVFRGA